MCTLFLITCSPIVNCCKWTLIGRNSWSLISRSFDRLKNLIPSLAFLVSEKGFLPLIGLWKLLSGVQSVVVFHNSVFNFETPDAECLVVLVNLFPMGFTQFRLWRKLWLQRTIIYVQIVANDLRIMFYLRQSNSLFKSLRLWVSFHSFPWNTACKRASSILKSSIILADISTVGLISLIASEQTRILSGKITRFSTQNSQEKWL